MNKKNKTLKGYIEYEKSSEVYQIWDIDVNKKEIVLKILAPDLTCLA